MGRPLCNGHAVKNATSAHGRITLLLLALCQSRKRTDMIFAEHNSAAVTNAAVVGFWSRDFGTGERKHKHNSSGIVSCPLWMDEPE